MRGKGQGISGYPSASRLLANRTVSPQRHCHPTTAPEKGKEESR